MLAHDVDFFDRRAAGHQRRVQLLKILERHARIERLLDQRGTAAGDEKEDQRSLVATRKPVEDRSASVETLRVGNRMPGSEGDPAGQIAGRWRRDNQNAVSAIVGRENRAQAFGHGKRRLAKGDGDDFAVVAKIYEVFCGRTFASVNARTVAGKFPRQGCGNVDGRKGSAENALRGLLHTFSSAAAPARATSRSWSSVPALTPIAPITSPSTT